MTTLLKVNPSCPSLYEVDDPSASVWCAFLFPENELGPGWGCFPLDVAWMASGGMPSYTGFFVFAPQAPDNPVAFAAALWASNVASQLQNISMPVWVANADANPLQLIPIPTTNTFSPTIPNNVNLGFGANFSFLIPSQSYFSCDQEGQFLTITAQQRFIFNVNGYPITGFDPALTLALTGPQAGLLALNARLRDSTSPPWSPRPTRGVWPTGSQPCCPPRLARRPTLGSRL